MGRPLSRKARAGQGGRPKKSQIVTGRRGVHPPHCMLFKTKKVQRRKKLYQMKPFADPVKEKERQRAISAKLNREKKKGLEYNKRNQVDQLKLANRRLSKEAVANRRKLVM